MNGAYHDEDMQELYELDGFDQATIKILTNPEYSPRLENFINFATIFVTDARNSAGELMALASAQLIKQNLLKIRTFNKTQVLLNTRRYIELVLDYGSESIGIMECTPFGCNFINDPATRRIISNFKRWIMSTHGGNLPISQIGFMFLTREVKHELNEIAWILLEAAHRTAIQLKIFTSYYDKLN